jgi:hypothetical protein
MKSLVVVLVLFVMGGLVGCTNGSRYTIYHYTCDRQPMIYSADNYEVGKSEFVWQSTEDDPNQITLYYQTICKFKDLRNSCITILAGDIKVVHNR